MGDDGGGLDPSVQQLHLVAANPLDNHPNHVPHLDLANVYVGHFVSPLGLRMEWLAAKVGSARRSAPVCVSELPALT